MADDVTSAVPGNLAKFADGKAPRVGITSTTTTLATFAGNVAAGCASIAGTPSSASTLRSLETLFSSMAQNELFVATIREAVMKADNYSNGVGSVTDADVMKALKAAGVATPPAPVTVPPVEQFGIPQNSGLIDDPICAANGNFVHQEIDIPFPGFAAALNVGRFYNSLAVTMLPAGSFGRGWTSIADVRLIVEDDEVWIHLGDGARVRFHETVDGVWLSNGRRSFVLHALEDGWELVEARWQRWRFDAEGVLLSGVCGASETSLTRDSDGHVVRVAESLSGRFVDYQWSADRVVATVASDGRRVDYAYDGDGDLLSMSSAARSCAYELADGLMIRARDADGVSEFENVYDETGRVSTQRSPFGRLTTYVYLDSGLTTFTGDDEIHQAMVHDRRGNMTAVIDADGRTMQLRYDELDRLVMVTDRAGQTWRYDYVGTASEVAAQIDPDGHRSTWAHDELGRVVRRSDRAGNTTILEYDTRWRTPSRIIDPLGAVTTLELDARSLCTSITDPDGVTSKWEWDQDGQLVATVDALGHRASLSFDEAGFLVGTVDPTGVIASLHHDAGGRVRTLTVGDRVAAYSYTPAGRMVGGSQPGGIDWSVTFGAHGRMETMSDAAGSTVGFDYDSAGNVITVTAPDGAAYQQRYDGNSRLVEIEDPAGAVSRTEHDANGVSIAVVEPNGGRWQRTIDAFGQTVTMTAPDGSTTRYGYHPTGEIAQAIGPDGRVWKAEIDALGRETAFVTPTGKRAERRWSPAGRLLESVSPSGATERYEYDLAGRCVAVVHADGHRESVRLDGLGRVVAATTADGVSYEADRDELGFVRVLSVDGERFGFDRDAAGRVLRYSDPTGAEYRQQWDNRGLLAEVIGADGARSRVERDSRGRTGVMRAPNDLTTTIRYDHVGRMSGIIDAARGADDITRDILGRVTGVHHSDGTGWTRTLDPVGRELARFDAAGGLISESEYDRAGRLIGVAGPDGVAGFGWDDDDVIAWMDRGARADATRRTEFDRDADGRIVGSRDDAGVFTRIDRDAGGNVERIVDDVIGTHRLERNGARRNSVGRLAIDRNGVAFRYDIAGRLAEVVDPALGVTSYRYGSGGLIESMSHPGGVRSYLYDDAGRLVGLDDGEGRISRFAYDAAGRRVSESWSDGRTVELAWTTDGVLSSITTTHAHGAVEHQEIGYDIIGYVARCGDTTIEVGAAAVTVGIERFVRAGQMVGVDGPIEAGPYPTLDDRLGAGVDPAGCPRVGRWMFTGARVLDTTTGMLLSPDPLPPVSGTAGEGSAYTYAWYDPINRVDPSGLRPLSDAEFEAMKKQQEQGRIGQAWDAIKKDPWGTLAMGLTIVAGVGLMFVPGGQAIGAGILIGVASQAAVGFATGTFSPRAIAVSGVIGGISGGVFAAAAPATAVGRVALSTAVGAGAGFSQDAATQYVTTGQVDWSQATQSGLIGGATGGLMAAGGEAYGAARAYSASRSAVTEIKPSVGEPAPGTQTPKVLRDGEGSTPQDIAASKGGPTAGKPVPPAIRDDLVSGSTNADGQFEGTCWRCGQTSTDAGDFHVGHRNVPRSQGGNLSPQNLALEGAACNTSAGARGAPSPGMSCAERGSCAPWK